MSNQPSNEDIQVAINRIEEALKYLKGLIAPPDTVHRQVVFVEKYISSSGNTTWRGACDDSDTVVYFRQVNRDLMEEAGIWEDWNNFDYDDGQAVNIEIETIPDGSFHKIVAIREGN